MPELTHSSIGIISFISEFLNQSLALNLDYNSSVNYLNDKLEKSLNSFSTKLNFAIHVIAKN